MQETRRGKSRNSFEKSIKARILIKLKGFGCVRIDPSYRTKMPIPRGNAEMVCVAIDKDKGSQYALKWAVDNLVGKGKYVTLIHVKQKQPSSASLVSHIALADANDSIQRSYKDADGQSKELFLPFRCFCTRKDIRVNEVMIEDLDIAKGICDYVRANFVENLVLGAPSKSAFVRRFKTNDVASTVSKVAPDFCNVFTISKGKLSSVRAASCPVPNPPPRQGQNQGTTNPVLSDARLMHGSGVRGFSHDKSPIAPRTLAEDMDSIKSPFTRGKTQNRSSGDFSLPDSDISFISSGRSSMDHLFPLPDIQDMAFPPRLSNGSETENTSNFGSSFSGPRTPDTSSSGTFPSRTHENGSISWSSSSSQSQEDVEAEMRRLKQELKQTMEMYSTACKEALLAKQKALELQRWKMEEQQKLEEARLAEEAALAIAEKEKAKCKVAIEAAEAAQRIAELEAQKRKNAEMKALREEEERKRVLHTLAHGDVRYRRYTIDEIETATDHFSESRKIGEGGYGPVYKCNLDHTPVAIKVLRPDASQGRAQFQQEVEVLSCIRHPNMVLLLGACPEYGCLVYEYMPNGSLDDRLFRRGQTPVLPWQLRFRIAAEIGTCLLFLHQTKPEPLVHRDLKPANILLDRNYVSKIGDVGLARLVPPSVADTVTQYLMTSTAGTFCYIDPEYQQTGMLGIKSDIYSLGVMLLQIITAKPPMGLTHHVQRAIEKGKFADMLDPAVPDWPVEEALNFAKLALKCAELRRKDRPDLRTVVLPELDRLRTLAEERMSGIIPSPATLVRETPKCASQVIFKVK
ncbi:unnamed protein product [Coffea canephora]|uniref:RING-type E3 ubiquitin transferase n=1 Tax=Coffea canephora TaxID=49390 RepID=A0A068UVA7_COFCA|nr:unnamed protein product [Coffea canephora]